MVIFSILQGGGFSRGDTIARRLGGAEAWIRVVQITVNLEALPGSGHPSEAYGAFSVDTAFTAV